MIPTVIKTRSKRLFINGIKKFVRPFDLTPDSPNQTMQVAALANDQDFQPMTVTQEGPFQGYEFVEQSDRFEAVGDHEHTIEITDSGSKKRLSNEPQHANNVTGTPEFPMVLPERLFLHEQRSLTIRVQNIFNRANDIRFKIHGRRVYQSSAASGDLDDLIDDLIRRSTVTISFFLTTTDGVVEALTVAEGARPVFFQTDADGYFEVFKMTAIAYDTVTQLANGTFDFIIRDAETRRELESGPMSDQLSWGTGLQPHILCESWLIRPKMRIEMEITNTTPTGNPIDVYLTMVGRKIYV